MKSMKKTTLSALMVALATLWLAGCGGDSGSSSAPTAITSDPTATSASMITTVEPPGTTDPMETSEPADTMEPAETMVTSATMEPTEGTSSGSMLTGPVADLFNRSSEAMKGVTSYHMVIQTEGAGVASSSEADVVLPDKMRMIVDTGAGKTEVLIIGNEAYTQVPGLDGYIAVPTGASNLAPRGDEANVLGFAETAEIVGDETLDGVETTHVRFSYDQDRAMRDMAAESDLPTPVPGTLGRADAEVWIEKSTGYWRKYTVTTSGATPSTSTITYSKFNEPITPPIEKPTNIVTIPGMDATTPIP